MFTCKDAAEMMTDEREAALPGGSRGFWYRVHMSVCLHCRRCRRQLDEAVALSKEIPAGDAPAQVVDAAAAAFRARRR